MGISLTHAILCALNNSEVHIAYTSWFYAPDLLSMVMFFTAALMATIQLMPLGKKA
ncbi:hypothetical protein [Pectobacterium punjabense]|uniref:hypothetical protein n=1 Tax=Pectobacterium punjabense TaxID=2108399 RepID=UPI00382FF7D2